MQPYEALTYQGKIRRMRGLAKAALMAFGLPEAHFILLKQAGNTLFRVYEAYPTNTAKDDRYAPGQYLLRIHQPGYQTAEAIALELTWLRAMRQDADLPVPEPVPTREGELLVKVCVPGVPGERNVSMLRWLKGRYIQKGIQPGHYLAQGRLMARLHNFAECWQPPAGLAKRSFDWQGLFHSDQEFGMPASEAWSRLPRGYVQPYTAVTHSVRGVMEQMGKAPAVYGLIHADLGMDANLLFWKGEAQAIDFDDSGYGYYLYDLSLALEHCQEHPALPRYREALLEGYTQFRPVPDAQEKYLEHFLAGYYVYLSLWCAAMTQFYPRHRDELLGRMERAYRLVDRYLYGGINEKIFSLPDRGIMSDDAGAGGVPAGG